MKKVKLNLSILPLDCWCSICQFFDNIKDVTSVCLVMKGLYDYITMISPQTTQNTIVSLKSIPMRKVKIVTNIKCENNEVSEDIFLRSRGVNSVSTALLKILFRFPNLMKLRFGSCQTRHQPEAVRGILNLSGKDVFHNLVKLDMRISNSKFIMKQSFPNLRTLFLRRIRNTINNTTHREEDCDLEIDFGMYPKLLELFLVSLSLKNPLNELQNRLEKLTLVDAITHEEIISKFDRLSEIVLSGVSLSRISTISNLSELKKLSFITFSFVNDNDTMDLRNLIFKVSIFSLPNLKEIYIDIGNFTYLRSEGESSKEIQIPRDVFLIKNFSCLEVLQILHTPFKIRVEGVPKLKQLSIFCTDNVEYFPNLEEVDGFCLTNIKIRISANNLLPQPLRIILENLSLLKHTLKSIFLRNEKANFKLSFIDFSVLEIIEVFCLRAATGTVEVIQNCPSLKRIEIANPGENLYLSELSSIQAIEILNINETGITNLFERIPNFSTLNQLVLLCMVDTKHNMNLLHEEFGNVKILRISNVIDFSYDGGLTTKLEKIEVSQCDSFTIRNHPKLQNIIVLTIGNVSVKNCSELVKVSVCYLDDQENENDISVELLDLPKCKDLTLSDFPKNCKLLTENVSFSSVKINQ